MKATPMRDVSWTERLLSTLDIAVAVSSAAISGERPSPAQGMPEPVLSAEQARQSAQLMRVNHAGEVAAQGLYQGQLLFARDPATVALLERAAAEEADHLAWCAERVQQLGEDISVLTPLWYAGAVAIGALASISGDSYSMGFLRETERQVEAHLDGHLERLDPADTASARVLERMRQDEIGHADAATEHGAAELPQAIVQLMRLSARVMTTVAAKI